MKKVKNAIIGFGKAGKTLAVDLGNRGESTILIEKDPKMYGGTCINVACIPSKKLATLAKQKPENSDPKEYYTQAIQEKKTLIQALNEANYDNIQETENVEVINGMASFVSEKELLVKLSNGTEEYYEAENIFINTGSTPNLPPLEGLEVDGDWIHTSETLMDDERLPSKLTIIGDGYVGLEFASIYAQFGSEVTLISNDSRNRFLATLDNSIATLVLEALEEMGIRFIFDADTNQIAKNDSGIQLTYNQEGKTLDLQTDKILVATGRTPNISNLDLAAANIILNEDGSIQINKNLQTNQRHIFAMGDVNGGPQHTYLSLDDSRIVKSKLFGDGSYNLAERHVVPSSMFINPPLSQVGLSEEMARANGYDIKIATLPVYSIPRAKLVSNTTGIYKAVVDANTDLILGVLLFGEDSHEVINIIATAMAAKLPYTALANQIFTHPSMAEALNDLFGQI